MEKKHTIHMIGNTHFDPVWLWTWDEGMSSIRSTFRAALDRMEEEPEFIYSFSCPPVFEWIRNVDPGLFARIAQRVGEGRWELCEGWWLQPDCNTASGESYARQGLYGQRYLMEHFRRMSSCAFNIDSFGHSATLPQILRKSGISYYALTRPSPQEMELPGPLFRWQSPDGSAVLAWREDDNHYLGNVGKHIQGAASAIEGLGHDMMIVYGVSNHGGAPTKRAIAAIKELGEDGSLPCDVRFGSMDGFFCTQEAGRLPVVRGDLMTAWFGVFSNFPQIKQDNRRCEYAILNAEKAAVAALLTNGNPYPGEKLTSGWKDLLFNQFHDILGGASIRQAYTDARNQHGRAMHTANEILHYSLQSVTKDIALPTGIADWNAVVWNLNAFEMLTHVEAEVQWPWELEWYKGPIAIVDDDGAEYPCQVIRERSVVPGFRSRFVFTAPLPSLGYKAFRVLQREPAISGGEDFPAAPYRLESRRYIVELCRETGCIASVFDKQLGRCVLKDGAKPAVVQDDGDTWAFNVKGFGGVLGYFRLEEARIIEDGPVRATIRTKGYFGHSGLEQDFTLYKQTDELESSYRVFWREQHKSFKLGFDAQMENPSVTAAAPYGSVDRKNDGVEMPMGEWLDLSGQDTGLAILTDSMFAYDAAGSVASLTVLRGAIFGDLRLPEGLDLAADYEYMGHGVTAGRWRLLFHNGDWRQARVPQHAMQFCNPPVIVAEANHPGYLPQQRSYLSADGKSSLLTVLKRAEDGNELIVRGYEYAGREEPVKVVLEPSGREFAVNFGKYEIKTLRLGGDGVTEVRILEDRVCEEDRMGRV